MPLNRRDGSYFGRLCALDPLPIPISDDVLDIFNLLAQTIALELEADDEQERRTAELRLLEDVVAFAGHDLRQPLTVLGGQLQLLARQARRGMPSAELAERADALLVQVKRAVALSETLLDMVQIETGTLPHERETFDLAALIRQVVDEVRLASLAWTFVIESPSSLSFTGDSKQLSRVLHNLLSNAVKYAPAESGPILVSLSVPDAQAAQIIVRDHGAGVTDAQLPRLFERRYRTPDVQERGVRGSGLGLYIVRQIIAAQGGTVAAEHAPGGGLLVRIRLPSGT